MALPPAKNPDIALLFRLRRYFIPFLFPAAALLVLALFSGKSDLGRDFGRAAPTRSLSPYRSEPIGRAN